MKNLELAVSLATQPIRAFQDLAERPKIWFPMLLTLVTTLGLIFWYYAVVDIEWLLDRSLSASRQLTEAQRDQAARFVSKSVLMWGSLVGGVFLIMLLRTLEATYYLLAGKITNVQRSFKHWFSLAWWSGLPQILAVIPAALLLLMSTTTQIDSGALQPLSLNELFFHRAIGAPGYSLFSNLTVLHPVAWLLTIVGVRTWSNRSWLFSSVFVLLPCVLCYGGAALYVLTR